MSNIPYDAQIAYLENTGKQYINTGFKPNQDTRIVATMQCVTSTNYGRLFGSGTHNTLNSVMIDYETGIAGTLHIKYGNNASWTTTSIHGDYETHIYDFNKNNFYLDGKLVSSNTYGAFQSTSNLGIFTYINGSSTGQNAELFIGRLYSFQIYDNDVLVRDYIPVRVNQEGCLYDKVSGELFSNAGTGNFIFGNDVLNTSGFISFFRRKLLCTFKNPRLQPIKFEDSAVKAICVQKWGGADGGDAANSTRLNGVKIPGIANEITHMQAESVIDFSTYFRGNTDIEYFREMEYFTNMTFLPQQGFYNCSNLKAVNLVNIVGQRSSGYHNCFNNCTSLVELGDTTNIEDLATGDFQKTAITSIDLPKLNLHTTDSYTESIFNGCANLTSVNMPINETIGINMFKDCNSLLYIKLPMVKTLGRTCFPNDIRKIILPNIENYPSNTFYIYRSNTVLGVIIGDKITSIANEAFSGGYALQIRYVVIKATTPPTCGTNILRYNRNPKIYVPDASVDAYKSTTGFDTYASHIYPISQFDTDFPGEYE